MTTVIMRNPIKPPDEPTAIIPQPDVPEPVIKNTFFFPDVDPKRIRELMRLEYTVSPERLRFAIRSGISETNAELYLYREQQLAAGFKTLADVPADEVGGESEKCFHYLSAVCAMTTATLYERYRGADASAKGDKKADSVEVSIDEHWRDMRWSIARLQGKPRCIVGQI
ncbi:TPA: head completion/stabilization protein [Serratia marcescens]|uniref:head completion/stabilization protein n=1 Tax=Serratia marcescens TaxID=615 RepID=UPI000E3C8A5A|nr:head completion/stabilization protein [Serratia marcescens]MBH2690121.1 head completion/stabilization protein [Serratia marcescens]MBH2737814.1 head completion/stabilization protein [Serratia marcescens]MBH3223456.1 head completion/stabilization protein [Serratia marcescens]QVV71867.1 head completion/stabilization protein [Serratia marcescens]QVV76276.1 head completion/stabilization protein [Serratia marcescens]